MYTGLAQLDDVCAARRASTHRSLGALTVQVPVPEAAFAISTSAEPPEAGEQTASQQAVARCAECPDARVIHERVVDTHYNRYRVEQQAPRLCTAQDNLFISIYD